MGHNIGINFILVPFCLEFDNLVPLCLFIDN